MIYCCVFHHSCWFFRDTDGNPPNFPLRGDDQSLPSQPLERLNSDEAEKNRDSTGGLPRRAGKTSHPQLSSACERPLLMISSRVDDKTASKILGIIMEENTIHWEIIN